MIERPNEKIRLLVAESFDLVRIGLRSLFENDVSIQLVGEVDSIEELYELTLQQKPDVLLVDLLLNNGGDKADPISKLLSISPQSKILVFSQHTDAHICLQTFRSGAVGVISKNHSAELLLKAIHAIHAGQIWFDRNVTKLLWEGQFDHNKPALDGIFDAKATSMSNLSASERQIAFLACKGLSAKEIGSKLLITEKTVRNQLSIIYKKIGVKKQIELCLKAPFYNYFRDAGAAGIFNPKNPDN